MTWYFDGSAPIYTQLVEQITQRIISGVFLPGQRFPSVRDLAIEAGVNPNTMQKALAELERGGLIYSQRTAGRFVTEDQNMIEDSKIKLAENQIKLFMETMRRLGYDKNKILSLIEHEAEEEVK